MLATVVRFCLLLSVLSVLGGCLSRPPGLADADRLPQDARHYLRPEAAENPLVAPETQARLDAEYNERFFAPWQRQQASLSAAAAFRGVTEYGGRQLYAENLQPLRRERWQKLVAALQQESYPALARPAITVRNTACRLFPTSRPLFLDPQQAGEGYPFDYSQVSALWTGTPLLVTHVSADGAWYFAETDFAAGWLPVLDIAWADDQFRAIYRNGRYAALLGDDVSLRDEAGEFLTQTHLGAVFPVLTETGSGLQLLVPVRDADGAAVARVAMVAPELAATKPLPLQPARIAELANRLLGQPYGWGGLYENRDCSATLRDLFAPFGLWLPRNSADQAKSGGTFYDLSTFGQDEKRDFLLQQGIPFYTLVWLKGHIGLYIGVDPTNDEPLLLHNLWGVRTENWRGRGGRALVGRLVITSLRPGEERLDVKNGRFYERIQGMTIMPGAEPASQ